MVEMIMVIPLLATIIGVTYFFGWSWLNQQQVRVIDRYAAWRGVYGSTAATQENLNSQFFDGRATINSGSSIVIDSTSAGLQTPLDFVDKVGTVNQTAGSLANELVNQPWPRGLSVNVSAEFPSSIGLWNKFQGAITSRSGREGVEWRYGQAGQAGVISERYFEDVNSAMDSVQDPGTTMAQMIKRLYQQGW